MLYVAVSLSLILLAVAGGFYIPRFLKKRTYRKYEKFAPLLLQTIQRNGVDIQPEDIRIHIKGNKRVDYQLDIYKGKDVVMVKTIEKNLQKMAKNRYPKEQIRIFTDFKKNGRRIN